MSAIARDGISTGDVRGPRAAIGATALVGMALTVGACQAPPATTADAAPPIGPEAFEGPGVPQFEFDPTWPKIPLPNNWIFGNMSGVHVDEQDHVWILQRGNTVQLDLGDDYLEQGVAECCTPAPSVVEFDPEGTIVQAWGGPGPDANRSTGIGGARTGEIPRVQGAEWPREHSLFVDADHNVWMGCNDTINGQHCAVLTKFTGDGTVIWQKGKTGESKGNTDTENFGEPAGIFVDSTTNEAFIADGYWNRRVIVIDATTGAFKRMWGAYGEPVENTKAGYSVPYDPAAPLQRSFGSSVHCIEGSRDGLLYVCDRQNNRIQVFTRDGTFVNEVVVARETRANGAAFDIALSPDPQQRFLYLGDGRNHKVHILRRDTLEVVGSFGHGGRAGGEFGVVHVLASDSQGNLYVGETAVRDRIQKFRFVGMK